MAKTSGKTKIKIAPKKGGASSGTSQTMSLARKPGQWLRRLWMWLGVALLVFLCTSVGAVVAYKWLPVPVTPLMLYRCAQQAANGQEMRMEHEWVPIDSISHNVAQAVMASEDNLFLRHSGPTPFLSGMAAISLLGVDFLLLDAVGLDLSHQRLERVDHMGANVAAHKDQHDVIAHTERTAVEPDSGIGDAGHPECALPRGFYLLRVIGEVHPGDGGGVLRALAHLGPRGLTHHSIVEEVHAAARGGGVALGFLQPGVHRGGVLLFRLLVCCRAVGRAAGGQHIQSVVQRADDAQQVLLCGLLAAGEIDDQGLSPDARRAAGETAAGRDAQALGTHGLGDAAGLALDDCEGRLGGDVPGGEAGTAGGEHQGDVQFIRAANQLRLDHVLFIRDDGCVHHVKAVLPRNGADRRPAGVHALAAVALVADGDDSRCILHLTRSFHNRRVRRRTSGSGADR